ncbi:hypothetical protein BGW80DRAFT_1467981 [Lactifluus volemus]|nr:hypothetical protein BGW80DRAFT_1467981 [Lactifluus volemus]
MWMQTASCSPPPPQLACPLRLLRRQKMSPTSCLEVPDTQRYDCYAISTTNCFKNHWQFTTSLTPTRTRPRPAGLSLRLLSLSPVKFKSVPDGELSTPAPTSTPSKSSGLKSLTLTSSPNLISSPPLCCCSSGPSHFICSLFRRASLTDIAFLGFSDPFELPKKRSNIFYKPSFHGLPTPELTLTTDRRTSTGSDSYWGQPSSITPRIALCLSITSCFCRSYFGTRGALSSHTESRPISVTASDASSSAFESSDGTLHPVTDLKAEWDELKLTGYLLPATLHHFLRGLKIRLGGCKLCLQTHHGSFPLLGDAKGGTFPHLDQT